MKTEIKPKDTLTITVIKKGTAVESEVVTNGK